MYYLGWQILEEMLIMRDFNYLDMCWKTISGKTAKFPKFFCGFSECFIFQKVEDETRELLILMNRRCKTKENLGKNVDTILEFKCSRNRLEHNHKCTLKVNFNKLREMLNLIALTGILRSKEEQEEEHWKYNNTSFQWGEKMGSLENCCGCIG